MNVNRGPHEHFEELISASLTGDISGEERRLLDAHLDGCAQCRETLASFAEQRRIMSGVRHVAPPRDLGARVRAGIEGGAFAPVPWWRRPATLLAGVGGGLAVVAGALFALVILNAASDEPQVGDASPTPAATVAASQTPVPTLPPRGTPVPTTPAPSASPDEPAPTATPVEASPEPDVYMALTGEADNLALTIRDGETGDTIAEADTPSGPPVAAEMSTDGQWLAYITPVGESGFHDVRATRVSEGIDDGDPEASPLLDSTAEVGETIVLGEGVSGGPFLQQLFWSPDGRFLAYTLADPETGEIDVWLFDTTEARHWQLTDGQDSYAGSWVSADTGGHALWISVPGSEPVSHLNQLLDDTSDFLEKVDPADRSLATVEGIFQPLLSPNGSLAIFWRGRMEKVGDEWTFSEGGAPWLSEHDHEPDEGEEIFENDRQLFSDLTIGREAFTSAAITWGGDGDAYAVWDAEWTGVTQAPDDEEYPDPERVYFGRATDERGLTRDHAIDPEDLPEQSVVTDVKVAPTGRHLLITALRPVGGVLEAPTAHLLMVTRDAEDLDDQVESIRSAEDGWFGPAAFDGLVERRSGD